MREIQLQLNCIITTIVLLWCPISCVDNDFFYNKAPQRTKGKHITAGVTVYKLLIPVAVLLYVSLEKLTHCSGQMCTFFWSTRTYVCATKIWRKWNVKDSRCVRINAALPFKLLLPRLLCSPLQAVLTRGHHIEQVPLVIESVAESFTKTKEAVAFKFKLLIP